jgi:alpha-2-macroglobulin-like protein
MSQPTAHVDHEVDDYLHDLLTPERAAQVERHCADCAACKAALDEARRRLAALQALPLVEPSGELLAAALRRIDAHEQKRRRFRRRFLLGTAAALLLAAVGLGAAHLYYLGLAATPYDLIVLGQRDLLAATTGSLRVRLVDRQADAPLAGVPVTVELRSPGGLVVELAHFSTDRHGGGQPRFRLPEWADGEYELRVTAQTKGGPEVVARTVRLKRSWKLMLTSDKPVYQPGQEIHVRALALRAPDLKPVAEAPAVFTLIDPRGNVLFKERRPTSRFGITFADCLLDREVAEGDYVIACKVGDTESRLAVGVKKYVLPKFKLDVRLDRPFYQPGDSATCTVQADYFFGKPVAGGALEVELRGADGKALEKRSARTDDKGKAVVVCKLPDKLDGRPQDGGDARLSFHVTLTDGAGQKATRAVDRLVTTRPVRIEVIPEGGQLVQDVPNTVYLFITRADGSPVSARLTVSGVPGELPTDVHGVASFEVTPRSGSESWAIRAADGQGKLLAQREVNLQCGRYPHDFLLRADRAVYRAGETMRLTALGGGAEPVFVDLLRDGQTLLTQTIDLTAGRGELAFDLPPDLFGTVQLCAYRLNADGLPVRKTRVVYVRPPGGLKVTTTLDQPEYRPGGKARLNLALTDAAGAPCPGALSLAAVDEAVFAALPQRPGMERAFYTLEQQLLKPVYSLYPWSPDTAAAPGRFEQALFAAAASVVASPGPRIEEGRSGAAPSLHSLAADTFAAKALDVEQSRWRGLARVKTGWLVLLGTFLLGGCISLYLMLRPLPALLITYGALTAVCLGLAYFLTTQLRMAAPLGPVRVSAGGEARLAVPDLASASLSPTVRRKTYLAAHFHAPWDLNDTSKEVEAPRVRGLFPETLLWRPQLVTDDQGRASLDVELADSITTWRLSASAVAADGRLGAAQRPLKVFQPFFVGLNLPVALTRGDEVRVPVVVYNYLDRPQTVSLALAKADWFTPLEAAEQRLDLAAGEVRSTGYRLRAHKVGSHELQVSARGAGVADALKRAIEVVPDGRRVEEVVNGNLGRPADVTLTVPPGAIDGSVRALVTIYPSGFSQLVEGLDNIFRLPSGCFEQTSSTTYPNVLALDYLKRTHQSAPAVEAKARQYIHLGYQRLIGFEVPGGGFDWFGRPPANRALTAYGLMEFEDMARVHDVDQGLIDRTRRWLLAQRHRDGSWEQEGHAPHDAPVGAAEQARLATTAYVAWAVFARGAAADQSRPTLDYLRAHRPEAIQDAHVLALVCNALLALGPQGRETGPYLDRLEALRRTGDTSSQCWWEQAAGARTTFYGAGRSGSIETTALAALALLRGGRPAPARAALTWLVAQKDAHGTWHSTQATVLTLKALVEAADRPPGGDGERRIQVRLGDKLLQELVIPADQAEVLKQLDLSPHLARGGQRLRLTETTGTAANYQVTLRYHVPEAKAAAPEGPLAVTLSCDRAELSVGEVVKATARVSNRAAQPAAMVMLELPLPAGFAAEADDFAALARAGTVARFQVEARRALVYLRDLPPGRPLELTYRLRAAMPAKVAVPGARVYEYYDPDRQGRSPGTRLTVTARQ